MSRLSNRHGYNSLNLTGALITELSNLFPDKVRTDIPLNQISRWKVGGKADVMVTPSSTQELSELRAWIEANELPSVVIGSTSNLLFADGGLNAIVIQINGSYQHCSISGDKVIAGPGIWVPGLARAVVSAGLSGLEHTCGIPGTLGGLIYMNGGSQRKGIGDSVLEVESVDHSGNIIVRSRDDCEFSYRSSIFQRKDEIISRATLQLLATDDKQALRREMLAILKDRRSKFPQKLPNCGSVFVSDPEMYSEYGPPGKIIEEAGFKGFRIGDAMVSEQHANFIVNTGQARAADILQIIETIKAKVRDRTGYTMRVEAQYVSVEGKITEL